MYGIFRYKLYMKVKRVVNSEHNSLSTSSSDSVDRDMLSAEKL